MSEASPLDALPDLYIAQLREQYAASPSYGDMQTLIEECKKNNMLPFYKSLCADFKWEVDQDLIQQMNGQNFDQQTALEQALKDAQENQSEEDVRVAFQNLALFYIKIGDFENSKKSLADLLSHTVALGQKIDVVFCQMRVAFFFDMLNCGLVISENILSLMAFIILCAAESFVSVS